MEHPKEVGDRSTLAIMHALQLRGYRLLVPFGENARYDLAIDVGDRLRRVQCKTGRFRQGAVFFPTCSTYAHNPSARDMHRSYYGEVDDFAVFCPELGAVCLIPIEDLGPRRLAALRVDPPRNGQRKSVRFAAPYEIARFEVAVAPTATQRGRSGE